MSKPAALRQAQRERMGARRLSISPAAAAALLAALLVAISYGRGVASGGVLVPGDMLQVFAPWSAEGGLERPANGLLGDHVQQMYPWRVFVHQELAAGRFPLWNPYGGGGSPLFANGQSAVLFPLNLAVIWLAPDLAATAVQLAKQPLAAAGTALFLRALGLSGVASAFGGLAWAFSGPMVAWLGWPHTNALAVLPWLFWTSTRWLQRRSLGWWAGMAAAVAVQLLGGHPETSAHNLFVLGIFVLFWVGRELAAHRHTLAQATGLVGGWMAAAVAGVGLAAVQVVPLAAAILDSLTAAERSSRWQAGVVLEPETAITWLAPNFFGTPLAEPFGALRYLNYNETIGYAGLGTALLAAVSVMSWRRRGWAGLLAVTVVALGLTYGVWGLTEFRRLPGLAHASNTRFVFVAAFGIACLGAIGLEACLNRPRGRVWWAAIGLAVLAGAGAMGLALAPDRLVPGVEGAAPLTPLEAAGWRQGELARVALLAVLWLASLGVWRLLRHRSAVVAVRIAPILLVVALMVDLFSFGARYNPTIPRETLTRAPEAVQFILEREPGARVMGLGEALLPNTSMLFRLGDLRAYEPVAHRRLLPFFERVDRNLEKDIRSRFYLFVNQPSIDLLSLGGVRWLLVPLADRAVVPVESLRAAGLIERFSDGTTSVWENPRARPRAYLADRLEYAATESQALAAVVAEAGRGGAGAVVEGEGGAEGAIGTRDLPSTSRVAPTFGVGRTEVEVATENGAFLVVNDALYPGWTAWVDGAPAPLVRANYLFMGVEVPPGAHSVLLEYRPAAVVIGAALSLGSVFALAVALVWRRRSAAAAGDAERSDVSVSATGT